jgi:hypothetical protein
MLINLLKKYSIALLGYMGILYLIYNFGMKIWLPYLNLLLYFITFILIHETHKISVLNKSVVGIFKYFYLYLSIVLIIPVATRVMDNPKLSIITYVYSEIGVSIFILFLTFYLFVISLKSPSDKNFRLLIISFSTALILTILNYNKLLLDPVNLYSSESIYFKSYIIKLISILLLLIFWIKYYKKHFNLSEYLNIFIFLFMLSNILEALHYVFYQHNIKIYVYSQYYTFLILMLTTIFWYIRLEYLNSDLAKQNEKYLANYQYLEGLVDKPHSGLWHSFLTNLSINYFTLFFVVCILGIFLLYLTKFINLYLMFNTIFIFITAFLAVYFSFSSIKRNWSKNIGSLISKKKEKV